MSISSKTKKMLLAKSGGYCQNPECNVDLYHIYESGGISNIEELAHIIAKSDNGPRGNKDVEVTQRDEFKNIILLCPTCHTKIDKAPAEYSVEKILKWKTNHEDKIHSLFKVPIYSNRTELRNQIQELLLENNAIFTEYGPQSDFAINTPITDASTMWREKSIQTLIPNNRTITELLKSNFDLLNSEEKLIFMKFKNHKEGFEYNQLSGDKNSTVTLFPKEINEILK